MYYTMIHFQSIGREIELGRITNQCFIGIPYLCIFQHVTSRTFGESHTLPLIADAIIGQIVKHIVKPIPSHRYMIRFQLSVYVHSGTIVEIEIRILDGQFHTFVYLQGSINDQRHACLYHRILLYLHVIEPLGIPGPGPKTNFLLCPTLQCKQQVVFHQ